MKATGSTPNPHPLPLNPYVESTPVSIHGMYVHLTAYTYIAGKHVQVMEAKARKKVKAVRANQKLSAKMDGVVGDSDTSDKVPSRANRGQVKTFT